MVSSGWVKLHRQALMHQTRRFDPTAWRLFETLLLLVDRTSGEWSGGRRQLASFDGSLTEATIYKAQKRLQKSGMIEVLSNNKYSTYRICNFAKFNDNGNNEVTTKSQPSNTLTRSKKKEDIYRSVDKELLEVLNETTGRSFRTLPTGYKKTLETFTLDEIKTALTNLANDEWHKSKLAELKSDYLLRSSTIDNMLSRNTKAKAEEKQYGNEWFDSQRV